MSIQVLYGWSVCISLPNAEADSLIRIPAVIKRDALDSWYEVKSALQTSKDHRYYKEADAEMQRIASRG